MSPIYSEGRKAWLLTVEEVMQVFGISESTVKRQLARAGGYSEVVSIKRPEGGATRVKLIDPYTIGLPVPGEPLSFLRGSPQRFTPGSEVHLTSQPSLTAKTQVGEASRELLRGSINVNPCEPLSLPSEPLSSDVSPPLVLGDLDAAQQLHELLIPVLRSDRGSRQRSEAIDHLAAARDVTPRTVRRWVAAFERGGLGELSRVMGTAPRADRGTHRLPPELVQVVRAALISNPPSTSARMIHRTVLRAVPELAHVPRKNGRVIPISVPTIQAIKDEMLDHPTLRLLFADADARKEYTRTYSGEVLAAHANDMWQMDMTRCDVVVYDPEARHIFRPRVQAVIDVYSGAIMGIAFSHREDQEQADLVLARSLMRKQGPLAERYPMFGVARRLYIDNGKTYKSQHFHRLVSGVGMEIIHSRPRVSHTRGKIERFFGTLHALERSLVGYVGENAKSRSTEELRRLSRNTLSWAETGRTFAPRDRLMTLSEYQQTVLRWLIVEYHETVVHGLSRAEHFRQTAPASTLIEFDPNELRVLFSRWEERVVRADGTVTIGKQQWTTPNGRLAQYQGQTVLVMTEPFALGEAQRAAAWRDRQGRIHPLGDLLPAPSVADSLEAAAQRRANRLATAEQIAQVQAIRQEVFDPGVTVAGALEAALPEQIVRPVLPAARARLEAVNPAPAPTPSAEARAFMAPMNGDDVPDDLDDLNAWLRS